MQTEKYKIKKIKLNELSIIKDFAPVEWHLDLEQVYSMHFGRDYFYPIVAIVNDEIVGTGIAILNENVSWLGTIIVKESHRNKGIGNAITVELIEYSRKKGIESIILTASDMGLPIYKKLGFVADINYLFFKSENPVKIDSLSKNISKIIKDDYQRIFELDHSISGEIREKLLINFLETGYKFYKHEIEGFYLPDFGKGLIIANTEIAGIELLKFRLSFDPSSIGIPETNSKAIAFLKSNGFFEYFKTPRMFLNKNVNWVSEKVYSRGCGYMG
jgi:GNAT superfamily N-acetyltransferase